MSEVFNLHQTFTECVSNQSTHFDMSIWQIYTASYERFSDLMRVLEIFMYYYMFKTTVITYNFIKLLQIVLRQKCRTKY